MFRLLLFISCLFSLTAHAQSDVKRVLFIGNSYTGSNNLPSVFQNFSNAAGDSVQVLANTPGGYTFQGHTTNATTLAYINQGNWDFVALQEQSQIPSFPISQVQTECFPYAETLNDAIEAANPCGETVFYMTWGRENGDAGNCPVWPPVCTYEGMDSLLFERYMQMAEDNDAIVSPVGAVWRFIRNNFTNIDLYTNDGSHPTQEGTYAAACAFYTVIHRKDPSQVAWDYSISATDAFLIRTAAKEVVFDSLERWFVGAYDTNTVAGFDADTTGLTATFTNNSTNATGYLWMFGDGDTSTQVNPVHTYDTSGTFDVTLISYYCNLSDTSSQQVIVSTSVPQDTTDTSVTDTTGNSVGISRLNSESPLIFFPNPADDFLQLKINPSLSDGSARQIALHDLQGRPVLIQRMASGTDELTLNLSGVPQGTYILSVRSARYTHRKPVVIRH